MNYIQKTCYKITIVGNSGVGKSSVLHRYILGLNNEPTVTTITANFHSINAPDPGVKLHFWDTAGQERYRAVAPIYFKGSSACVCVFDVTDKKSFLDLDIWIKSYKNHCMLDNPMIIILANKVDLPISLRQVSDLDVYDLAKTYDCDVIFTSAKSGINMIEFHSAINKLYYKIRQQRELLDLNRVVITEPIVDSKYCCNYF
jgi:small GTP-binding protein